MSWESGFALANGVALAAWLILMLAPRWAWLKHALGLGVVGGLCVAYAALAQAWLFQADGGGFFSLAGVMALFDLPPMALAGWIHYLAFDLLVGLWIAARADVLGLPRLLQLPILAITFMAGPLGLLLHGTVEAALVAADRARIRAEAAP